MGSPETPSVSFHREAPLDLDANKKLSLGFIWLPSPDYVAGTYIWRGLYTIIEPGLNIYSNPSKRFEAHVTPVNATTVIETLLTTEIDLAVGQTLCVEFYLDPASTANDGEELAGADVIEWYLDYTNQRIFLSWTD